MRLLNLSEQEFDALWVNGVSQSGILIAGCTVDVGDVAVGTAAEAGTPIILRLSLAAVWHELTQSCNPELEDGDIANFISQDLGRHFGPAAEAYLEVLRSSIRHQGEVAHPLWLWSTSTHVVRVGSVIEIQGMCGRRG